MIPHTGVTQEIIENIDTPDTITPIDIINVINRIALDRLIDSRDTYREPYADSEKTRAVAITTRAHQVVIALEMSAHVGETNIHVLTRPYATCHVLDVTVHNIRLQIANVLHHLNKSRRT